MTRFEELREKLRNAPKPDYEWLAHELQPPPAVADGDIKVRLDSFFGPSYAERYMAAWQALMPRATELAIPILYLQRHALELIVKDTIRELWNIREGMRLGSEVFGLPSSAAILDETDQKGDLKIMGRHKFEPLLRCLARNLEILSLPELPQEYHRTWELLEGIEQREPTRLRYETVPSGQASFSHSLVEPAVADIGQIAILLKTIATVHDATGDDPHDDPVSFMGHIVQRSMYVRGDVQSKLGALTKSTQDNEVVWRLAPTPAIPDGHPNMKSLTDVYNRCLATDFHGRPLVVLKVPRYGDYPHVLGCLHEGKLSRVVWPPPYQTDVVNAAFESWKRHFPEKPPVGSTSLTPA